MRMASEIKIYRMKNFVRKNASGEIVVLTCAESVALTLDKEGE